MARVGKITSRLKCIIIIHHRLHNPLRVSILHAHFCMVVNNLQNLSNRWLIYSEGIAKIDFMFEITLTLRG